MKKPAEERIIVGGIAYIREDITEPTWVDEYNMLEWQGATSRMSFYSAQELTMYNDTDDWRLPTLRELLSLVDRAALNRALVDRATHLPIEADIYWTSTPYIHQQNSFWCVSFKDGQVLPKTTDLKNYVILARTYTI